MLAEKADIEVISNIDGDKIHMSFDEDSVAHIMSILTNLYSDPEKAVIREYATNALDSHVEAGNPNPIEVWTPTALDPTLRIKDYGVGLSHEDIENIYSKYGASTKRETNEQVGMLGLGCKSALAYTSQFTLTGIKDGVRIQVIISRDEDGGGSMDVIDHSETDEPNGVEVQIPSKSTNVERKAKDFFKYWEPGTVLVNGEEPAPIDGLKLSDTITIVKDDGYHYGGRESFVVMGNVPYPVARNADSTAGWTNHLPDDYYAVMRVPMGDVQFTPAREDLNYTKRTKATLERLAEEIKDGLVESVQRQIDTASNKPEAIEFVQKFSKMASRTGYKDWKYKGTKIPEKYTINDDAVVTPFSTHGKLSTHDRTKEIQTSMFPKAVWVHGWDCATFSGHQKKKLLKWAEDHDVAVGYYILSKDAPKTSWIDTDRLIPWPEIKAIKLPRNTGGGGGKVVGTYECWTEDGYAGMVDADKIDTANPIFYEDCRSHSYYDTIVRESHSKVTIVRLPKNRIAKFERTFPMAKPIKKEAERLFKKWEKTITPRRRKALYVQDTDGDDVEWLDPLKLDDPKLRKYVRYAQLDLTEIKNEYKMYRNMFDLKGVEVENPFDNTYPLFDRWTAKRHPKHTYLYLNAVYAARKA